MRILRRLLTRSELKRVRLSASTLPTQDRCCVQPPTLCATCVQLMAPSSICAVFHDTVIWPLKGPPMKKVLLPIIAALLLFAGFAVGQKVRDWPDLNAARDHIKQAIQEMDRARAANHYDMAGHGAKAEQLLRQAEHEVNESIEAARKAK